MPDIESIEDISSSPGSQSEVESSTEDDACSVSCMTAPPVVHHNTSSGELEHVSPDALVKHTIVSKAMVMDVLALHLDRSVRPGSKDVPMTQRWEHLADEFKVPDDTKRQCENFNGTLSPSESMFDYLCVTNGSLPIEMLKDHLRGLGRKDVVADLDKNDSLSEDKATVRDLVNNHPETLNNVCLKLDGIRSPKNWNDLGIALGIPRAALRQFKDPSGCSPSRVILEKIETVEPNLRKEEIQKVLRDYLKLPDIANALNELQEGSTIKTLLDNDDVRDEVTAMLDLQESSWFRFGRKFKINRKELENLIPEPVRSPTKVLMECIIQKDPDLTVKTFLDVLAKIKRNDAINELQGFFYFTWM